MSGAEIGTDRAETFLGADRRVVDLDGGRMNRTFRVRSESGSDQVIKLRCATVPAVDAWRGDAATERAATAAASRSGAGPRLIECEAADQRVVTEYVSGRPLRPADLRDPHVVDRVTTALRRLHGGEPVAGRFDPTAAREVYLIAAQAAGLAMPEGYLDLLPRVEELERALALHPEPLVPCHNDLATANLIDDGERVCIIDYEFAAMSEASADVGSLIMGAGLDAEAAADLVTAYWARESESLVARARLWAFLEAYSFVPWGLLLSADPRFADFGSWAEETFSSVQEVLADPSYPVLLDLLMQGA